MNQEPAIPRNATHPGTTPEPVVLGWLHLMLAEVGLAAIGLTGYVALHHHSSDVTHPFGLLGFLALIWATVFALAQIRVHDGRLTFRDQFRASRSVDLTQLTSVTAPAKPERWLTGRRFMVLTDQQGAQVRLTLYGTRPSQRRTLLAALEPYVQADGVTRAGLVDEALSGELWWPHRRRRSS